MVLAAFGRSSMGLTLAYAPTHHRRQCRSRALLRYSRLVLQVSQHYGVASTRPGPSNDSLRAGGSLWQRSQLSLDATSGDITGYVTRLA